LPIKNTSTIPSITNMTSASQTEASATVADPCRVFIGNLNYQTKEKELQEICEKHVGKV
jgi:RNA recognition motif-containing protein